MIKVKYTGSKKTFPVMFPVGAKSRGAIRETKMVSAGEEFEVEDSDAHKLVKLDPAHFAYVDASIVPPAEASAPAEVPAAEQTPIESPQESSGSEYEEYTPEAKSKKGKKK